MRWLFALCLTVSLAACTGQPADPRSQVSRARIAAATTPLLFVEVPELGAGGTLVPSGRNGDVVTWRTPENLAFSFRDGVLVSTRGLGFDLMSADVSGTIAALAGASGEYELFHSFLDGQNRTVFRSYRCTMAPSAGETINIFGQSRATQRHDETCRALGVVVQNSYWTAGGTMWQSRQWIGDELGYLVAERLAQ